MDSLSEQIFNKYQKLILKFANSKIGRKYLSINHDGEIVKIVPNAFYSLNRDEIEAVFYGVDVYGRKLNHALTALEIIDDFNIESLLHYLRIKTNNFVYPKVMFDEFNPNANAVDGYVERASESSWASSHDVANGDVIQTGSLTERCAIVVAATTGSNWWTIRRGFFLFDTSSLTAASTVASGTFSLYVNTVTDQLDTGRALAMINTNPASNTTLVAGDYTDGVESGTTQQATNINLSALNTSAYNDFTLNATGISNISKTGVTKFGTRIEADRANTVPTWVSGDLLGVNVNFSESASNRPRLTLIIPRGSFIFNLI